MSDHLIIAAAAVILGITPVSHNTVVPSAVAPLDCQLTANMNPAPGHPTTVQHASPGQLAATKPHSGNHISIRWRSDHHRHGGRHRHHHHH